MCTVSFFRGTNNDFILTSNRDETPDRITLRPEIYAEKDGTLLYPRDSRAGGTWIGLSDRKRLVCVLNGAFENHKRQPPYNLSRGQISKYVLLTDNLISSFTDIKLQGVEPFTMIILDWHSDLAAFEWVWDSKEKYLSRIIENKGIWSSSSLYSEEMKEERRKWFYDFITETGQDPGSIWKFHHEAGKGNSEFGVIMNRGFVCTTSITQVVKSGPDISMRYEDLQKGELSITPFKIHELNNG